MCDEQYGENPASHADPDPLPPVEPIPTIEQRIVALESYRDDQQQPRETSELLNDVRTYEWWMMGLQGGTLLVTIVIAFIYSYQLSEMRRVTKETAKAAYSACFGSQIARSTLEEYQRSALDSHLASTAAYAQALVAMQSQKAFVDATFDVPQNRVHNTRLDMLMHLKNTGSSAANNVFISGWTIVASPEKQWISRTPKREKLFTLKIGSLRVGDNFMPDVPGTTKEGNPHGLYVGLLDSTGEDFIDTPDEDRRLFVEGNAVIFIFYTLSYEDFTAKYVHHACMKVFYPNSTSSAFSGAASDQCSKYNHQTEIAKVSMPYPSAPMLARPIADVTCSASSEERPAAGPWWKFW